ncbi:histidine phosphatase family protein [Asanoa sp. WMMD1127]|uniref:histidine phosphatase family protein n=1 Tax=Asanoa sp. WMMD1127 TaxID=3016107 RepID=UPI0024178B8B|nr:histidine phosphatase family protein [Asanoa sp. WMMD1127]MDG4820540.1 histidine phosphatase family protein [Asanoa sp. WMMD1127]
MTAPRVRLVLVRHGESHWNVEERYQGQQDSGLTPAGFAQAEMAAEVLVDRFGTADLVVTSDLPRARDTAAAYLRRVGGAAREDARLREIDVGTWGGRTRAEVAAAHPEEIAAFERGVDIPRGGGETFGQLRTRVWAALEEIAGAGTVVVFTHGGCVRVATAAALRVPSPGERGFAPVGNCSLTVIDHAGADGVHRLVAYNAPTAAGTRTNRVE